MSFGTAFLLALQLLGLQVAPAPDASRHGLGQTTSEARLSAAAPHAQPTVAQPDAPHDGRRSLFETETEIEGEASCCSRGQVRDVLLARALSCPVLMSEAPYMGGVRSSHAARAPPQRA